MDTKPDQGIVYQVVWAPAPKWTVPVLFCLMMLCLITGCALVM